MTDPFAAPSPSAQPFPQQAPPLYGAPLQATRNGLGTAALVLGILAIPGAITIIGGVLLGILAIILGAIGRSRAKRGPIWIHAHSPFFLR